MSSQDLIVITQPIDDSSGGVSEIDCTTQWDQDPLNETIVVRHVSSDITNSTAMAHATFAKIEDVLKRAVFVLISLYEPNDPNHEIECFLKRASLALMSVTVSPSELDKHFELHRQMSGMPTDGISELLETASEIRDFYSFAGGESTNTVKSRAVSGKLTGRFVRPEFPIVFDDDV